MADFNKGDRIVKMSGVNAGKYGTINSISDSGTLNVTFDGERLPRFCDPERCGKIGLNAKFKVGDKVKHKTNGLTGIVEGRATEPGNYNVRSEGRVFMWDEDDLVLANACAANAKFKVGDRVWFKAPVTGAKVTAKITATLGGEKYGFVDDDGIQGTIEGNAIYPLNSSAANATFKKGDRVIWKGRFGTVRGVVEGPTLAPGSCYIKLTDDVRITPTQRLVDHAAPASELTLANSRAANAEFKRLVATTNACRNASIDDEFQKLKAMGKANAEKYLKDNSQSLIDKYGYPEFVKLAKKIQYFF